MGVLLWIVSKLLTRSLRFPFLFHTIADGLRYGDFWKRINETFLDAAYAEDVYGNTTFRSLLNALFTQKGGYLYGHKKETVSSATGKGQVLEKQTILGEGLAGFLAMIDRSHSYKSMEKDGYAFNGWHISEPAKVAWWKTALFMLCFAATLISTIWLEWWIFVEVVKWVYPYVV